MGDLIVGRINLNDTPVVDKLRNIIDRLIQIPSNYYPLKFKPPSYFEISTGPISSEKGWYIILDNKHPLYVGKAENLNNRLNTNSGSIDNFANTKRNSDPERNFIKKFLELNILSKELRVCVIKEKELNITDMTDLDRDNIEKFINIFRCIFNYQ